jgi:hypothetical protein
VAYQHQPSARDAGLARVAVLTVALSVAGVAATAGIGVAIAGATPAPAAKKPGTDYSKTGKANQAGGQSGKPPTKGTGGQNGNGGAGTTKPDPAPSGSVAPPADHPESSSGDEQTSSGGS